MTYDYIRKKHEDKSKVLKKHTTRRFGLLLDNRVEMSYLQINKSNGKPCLNLQEVTDTIMTKEGLLNGVFNNGVPFTIFKRNIMRWEDLSLKENHTDDDEK